MALSTTQYGYIIDPMVPFTAPDGRTIRNGYAKVFLAGSSTPVITYANFDGTANQERIELDNSGRTATKVIGSKGSTYKVCVYDAEHSQETPILTVDNVAVIGASVSATNVVQGLISVEGSGWVKASMDQTTAQVEMDPSSATDVSISEFPLHDQDAYGVFLDSLGNPYKILLEDLSSSMYLGSDTPMSLVYALVTAGKNVSISMVDPNDNKNIITLHLATKRSDGMNRSMTFSSTEYDNKVYEIKYESSDGGTTWTSADSVHAPAIIEGDTNNTPPNGTLVHAAYTSGKIPIVKMQTSTGTYRVYHLVYANTYGSTYRRYYFASIDANNATVYSILYLSSDAGSTFTTTEYELPYTIRSTIAPDFNTSAHEDQYSVGSLVYHQNSYGAHKLYRCTTANDGGIWDPTEWTETTVAAELKRLASLI